MTAAWLTIIGIGDDGLTGLTPTARMLVETAEVIVGGARHLAMLPESTAGRLPWKQPFADSIAAITERRGKRIVVLASGDPMWFGAGAVLARHFPREEISILPHPGAFSLAAARLGWAIAECALVSLHARPIDALRLHLAEGRHILILSEDGGTPRAVARLLRESGWGSSRLTVLEHLGGSEEHSIDATAQEWGERETADLNTVALECRAEPGTRGLPRLAGLPDEAFEHDGQLTKREIRAVTLASLAPVWGETLWDVGAGCGSVAIEWLRAAENLTAVAIERDPARAAMIARNAAALGVPALRIVPGAAPGAVADLATPDAIFVGGGIAEPGLLPALWEKLRPGGRLVANVISVEGERTVLDSHARYGGNLTRLAVSRAEPLGRRQVWRPLIAVTQWMAIKPS